MQLDIQKLSGQYQARHMTEDDLPELLALGAPVRSARAGELA